MHCTEVYSSLAQSIAGHAKRTQIPYRNSRSKSQTRCNGPSIVSVKPSFYYRFIIPVGVIATFGETPTALWPLKPIDAEALITRLEILSEAQPSTNGLPEALLAGTLAALGGVISDVVPHE